MVITNEKRHHENVGVTDAIQGASYQGGGAGFFNGEMGGYYQAKQDEYCHDCCADLVSFFL
jgi:hypothetical protein